MSPLEIISRLCDVTENLSAIVKKQQTIIEQSKIEEAVRAELRQEVEETDREMDVLEYHINGKWGNGSDRTNRLTAAGYDAKVVQNEVNRILR